MSAPIDGISVGLLPISGTYNIKRGIIVALHFVNTNPKTSYFGSAKGLRYDVTGDPSGFHKHALRVTGFSNAKRYNRSIEIPLGSSNAYDDNLGDYYDFTKPGNYSVRTIITLADNNATIESPWISINIGN